MVSFLFLVYLVTILYCSDIVWSKDLSGCFFCFLLILDREFSFPFCFLPLFDREFSFFFAFSHFFLDWEFSLFAFCRSRIRRKRNMQKGLWTRQYLSNTELSQSSEAKPRRTWRWLIYCKKQGTRKRDKEETKKPYP